MLITAAQDIRAIWIKPSGENALRMVAVLNDFGFGSLGLTEQDFLKDNYVTQLGYPPLRIDILNAISGVEFDEAYDNKVNGEVDVGYICHRRKNQYRFIL